MGIRTTGIIDTGQAAASLPLAVGAYRSYVVPFDLSVYYHNDIATAYWGSYWINSTNHGTPSFGTWSDLYVPRGPGSTGAGVSLSTDNVGSVITGRVYILYYIDVMNLASLHNSTSSYWNGVSGGSFDTYATTWLIQHSGASWSMYRV